MGYLVTEQLSWLSIYVEHADLSSLHCEFWRRVPMWLLSWLQRITILQLWRKGLDCWALVLTSMWKLMVILVSLLLFMGFWFHFCLFGFLVCGFFCLFVCFVSWYQTYDVFSNTNFLMLMLWAHCLCSNFSLYKLTPATQTKDIDTYSLISHQLC